MVSSGMRIGKLRTAFWALALVVAALALSWQLRLTIASVVAAEAAWRWAVAVGDRRVRRALFGVSAGALLGVVLLLPPRRARPGARAQSIVVDAQGDIVPMPWLPYLGNLVPEADLIRFSTLGKDLFPFPVRGGLLEELRAMGAWNNAFVREYRSLAANVPSVLLLQALQDLGFYRGYSHVVVLLPASAARAPSQKLPVFVFLHGFMGSFQFYSSWWTDLADAVVVLPSTKSLVGHWQKADLDQLADVTLPLVERQVALDRSRMHLVGLSNGGWGVNRALRTQRPSFASYTFLSTWVDAMPPGVSHRTPLVLIYGDRDSMAANNRQMTASLREAGYDVRAHPFAGERHFVMIVRRDEIRTIVGSVLTR